MITGTDDGYKSRAATVWDDNDGKCHLVDAQANCHRRRDGQSLLEASTAKSIWMLPILIECITG
jgi:hypothetical protein